MAGETLQFGAIDIGATAHIPLESWAEILKGGPTSGDLVEFDFIAGAEWEPGEAATYSIVVAAVIKSKVPEVAWGDALALSALRGVQDTLSRTYTTDVGPITETCEAVITGEVTMLWESRTKVTVVLVFQILTEWA